MGRQCGMLLTIDKGTRLHYKPWHTQEVWFVHSLLFVLYYSETVAQGYFVYFWYWGRATQIGIFLGVDMNPDVPKSAKRFIVHFQNSVVHLEHIFRIFL